MNDDTLFYEQGLLTAFRLTANRMQPAIQHYGLDPQLAIGYIVAVVGILTEKNELEKITSDIDPEKVVTLEEVIQAIDKHITPFERAYERFLSAWIQGTLALSSYPFSLQETLDFIKDEIQQHGGQ